MTKAASSQVEPSREQAQVISAPCAPVLVVAGAGSGKTTTMAERVVHLVTECAMPPEAILGLTFTRKAARELAERVRSKLTERLEESQLPQFDLTALPIFTYNAFAASVVREHGLRIGADPDAKLINAGAANQIMRAIVETWHEDLGTKDSVNTVVRNALSLADSMRSHLVSPEEVRRELFSLIAELDESSVRANKYSKAVKDLRENLEERCRLLGLVGAFEGKKRELGLVEFSDQVALACQIARDVPAVQKAMRSQYRAVILDEFQDTSFAQLKFLADLFGRGFPVMAVGDPNQAIYGWRGASASSLVDFCEHFGQEGNPVTVHHLTVSWRNDKTILQAANTISSKLAQGTGSEAEKKAKELLKELKARQNALSGTIHRSVSRTAADEAREVARWIKTTWDKDKTSAAVLCRTRQPFTALVSAFREIGIEPEVVGLSGLVHTPEIVDLRAALTVCNDPARGDAMMRLLTNARISPADLAVLSDHAHQLDGAGKHGTASIVEAVFHPPSCRFPGRVGHPMSRQAYERIERLSGQLNEIRQALGGELGEIVHTAERALQLDIELAAHRAGSSRANLDAFAGHVRSYAAGTPLPTLAGFLGWLDEATASERGLELGEVEVSKGAVQILTVHAAKGLEWDVVALPDLVKGRFPAIGVRGPGKYVRESGWVGSKGEIPGSLRGDWASIPQLNLESDDWGEVTKEIDAIKERFLEHRLAEERRLAYVAVTRARHQLLLSASWQKDGVKSLATLSEFFTELKDYAQVPRGFECLPQPQNSGESPREAGLHGESRSAPSYPATDPLTEERRACLERAADLVRGQAEEYAARYTRAEAQAAEPALAAWRAEAQAAIAVVREQCTTAEARLLSDDLRAVLAAEAEADQAGDWQAPSQMSASAALRFLADPGRFEDEQRRPLPTPPAAATRAGTAFHAKVEAHFNEPAVIFTEDWLGTVPSEEAEPQGEGDEQERWERFLASPFAARKPRHVELDLETAIAGRIFRARIDAVFEEEGGVRVVDWKTGRKGDIGRRLPQLSIYRLAYSRAAGLPLSQVRASFFFVDTGETVDAEMLSEGQIEALFANTLQG